MKTKIFLILTLLIGSMSFAQLPTDQIAKYSFTNGSLVNIADPGNGDLSGGAVSTSLLKADRFGATNSAIRIESTLRSGYTFTGTNNNISISFWMTSSTPTSDMRIFQVYDGSGYGLNLTASASNTLTAQFKNTGSLYTFESSQSNLSIFDGNWHHIVFTTNKTSTGYNNSIYIDGALHTVLSDGIDYSITSLSLYNVLTSDAAFKISPTSAYYGNIDDIGIFDRTISAAEVQSIYNQTNPVAATFYVNAAATGNNDGTTWADAFTDLQSALVIADETDEVWVAKGTYKPHVSDRDKSFIVNTFIYGGFDGTEIDLSDRDMSLIHTTNETILSGDLLGDDNATIDFNDTTRDDNSYHVVEVSYEDITIDGVTIKDGNADLTTGDNRFGAGLFKTFSIADFTIKNCIVKNNTAFSGAGLSLITTSTPSNINVDACIIENNLANTAAGIDYHYSGTYASLNISITNTLFEANKTADDTAKSRKGDGAAAARLRAYYNGVYLNADLINNTFVNNVSNGSGTNTDFPVVGISRYQGSFGYINIANNIFWGNTKNGTAVAKGIGATNNEFELSQTDAIRIVTNNTDEDGLSLITGTTATSITNPNLDANFKLTTGSPAIDTGDNTYATTASDLLGNQRIFNTTVDMGAYEFGSSPTLSNTKIKNEVGSVIVLPNPASSYLNIATELELNNVEVYNLQGAKVLTSNNSTIDVSNFAAGVYIIKVELTTGSSVVKRFVKQ